MSSRTKWNSDQYELPLEWTTTTTQTVTTKQSDIIDSILTNYMKQFKKKKPTQCDWCDKETTELTKGVSWDNRREVYWTCKDCG